MRFLIVYQAYCNTLGKNLRSTWKLTNSIFGKTNKNSHDSSINQNDTHITDDLQLDNMFINYFSQFGSERRQQIPSTGRDPLKFFNEADKNL